MNFARAVRRRQPRDDHCVLPVPDPRIAGDLRRRAELFYKRIFKRLRAATAKAQSDLDQCCAVAVAREKQAHVGRLTGQRQPRLRRAHGGSISLRGTKHHLVLLGLAQVVWTNPVDRRLASTAADQPERECECDRPPRIGPSCAPAFRLPESGRATRSGRLRLGTHRLESPALWDTPRTTHVDGDPREIRRAARQCDLAIVRSHRLRIRE